MKLPITIEYTSGDSATYTVQPPEWQKWETKFSVKIGTAASNLGVSDLLFLAYHAHKREAAGVAVKPYEAWMETVADVIVGESDPKAIQSEA